MLCEAVCICVDLGQKIEGGGSKREHLERIEKQTGKQQIVDFEVPIEGMHIWNWFWDLSARRPQGFGASLIPYSEFEAWIRVRKVIVHDCEIDILVKMDEAFLSEHHKIDSKKNKGPK